MELDEALAPAGHATKLLLWFIVLSGVAFLVFVQPATLDAVRTAASPLP